MTKRSTQDADSNQSETNLHTAAKKDARPPSIQVVTQVCRQLLLACMAIHAESRNKEHIHTHYAMIFWNRIRSHSLRKMRKIANFLPLRRSLRVPRPSITLHKFVVNLYLTWASVCDRIFTLYLPGYTRYRWQDSDSDTSQFFLPSDEEKQDEDSSNTNPQYTR